MKCSGEQLRKDAAEAFERARRHHRQLRDIYDYFMPYRISTPEQAGSSGRGSEGATRTDKLFDATGPAAAFNFAGRLQADWMPLNQPFFKIEAGPLIPDGDAKKRLNEQLAIVGRATESVIQAVVPPHVHEFAFDLFAGTGAMIIDRGKDPHFIRPRAVPIVELAIEDGPWGEIWHIWWKRNYRGRDLPSLWPNGKFSERLNRAIKEKPNEHIEVIQYTCWCEDEKQWCLKVWADSDETDAIIHEEDFRVNPWIITRFFKVPGESYGRGLGHLGLPFVKTANKTRELALTAAAMAVMGIFMVRNDGVFNIENSPFQALAMWPVASTGGPMGPTVQRLPVPQDFDVTSIVMEEERQQIRKVTMNDELPPEEMAVRSATEVAGRLRRYARQWGGVNTRLGAEWIVPKVRRTIDVMQDTPYFARLVPGFEKGTRITLDQLLTKVSIVAPAMASQKADRVENAVNYLQILTSLFGPQAPMIITRAAKMLPAIGRDMAIDEEFIASEKEITDGLKAMAEAAAQANAKPAPPPDPKAQAQSYVNGSPLQ